MASEWTFFNLLILLLLLELPLLFEAQLRHLLAFLEPLDFLFHNTPLSNFCSFSLRPMPKGMKKLQSRLENNRLTTTY